MFSGIDTQEIHRFLKISISRNSASLTERGIDSMNFKNASKNSKCKQVYKITPMQIYANLSEQGKRTQNE